MHKIFSCWGTDFSDLVLRRCLELQPNLGNLLLELKDLGLVARTDYEELLTNLCTGHQVQGKLLAEPGPVL